MVPNSRIFLIILFYKIVNVIGQKDILHPDTFLSIEDLTRKYGYSMEMHEVTTEDGYILEIFRLFPQGEKDGIEFKKPVLITHGLQGQSENYILNGMNNGSLAYFLADNGYDVWLGNSRGTQHGKKHLTLSPDDKEFWDFSFHEIALYDLPASIDYILDKSNSTKISIIGYSQGGTIFFALCSMRPEYQEKIIFASLLAPSTTQLYYNVSFVLALTGLREELGAMFNSVNLYDFPPSKLVNLSDILIELCQGYSKFLCLESLYFLYGYSGEFNENLVPLIWRFFPSISTKQILHYAQNINSKHFRPFDYGTEKNMKVYGKPVPDDYPIENISVPIAFYYGLNDNLVFYKDVENACSVIKNCVRKFMMPNKKWTHIDFIYSKNLKNVLFKTLVKFARKYEL